MPGPGAVLSVILADLDVSTLSPEADFSPWRGFAYPAHARSIAAREFSWLAVAALREGAPAGLALAKLDGARAELLSVFVAPELRRQGVGAGLLSRLADAQRRTAGVEKLSASYSSRIACFEAVEKMLPRAGLGAPFDKVFFGIGDMYNMPPWAAGAGERRNADWRCLSLAGARAAGLDPLALADKAGGPPQLDPRYRESELDWETSHMVFSGGACKGWFVAHRFAERPDTLYYSRFWVDPEFGRKHRVAAVLLFRAVLNTQRAILDKAGTPRYAAFDTPLEYASWLRSLGKHLVPYLSETWMQRGIDCDLSSR